MQIFEMNTYAWSMDCVLCTRIQLLFLAIYISHTSVKRLSISNSKHRSLSADSIELKLHHFFFSCCLLALFFLAFGISGPFCLEKQKKTSKCLNDRKWRELCKRKFRTIEMYPIYNKCHKIILWRVFNMPTLSRQMLFAWS